MANTTHTTHTGTTRTHVSMPTPRLREIDKLVGPRGRSEFVAEAAAEKVRRVNLLTALTNVAGSLKDDDGVPTEWQTPEGTVHWVRDLRQESDDRRNV